MNNQQKFAEVLLAAGAVHNRTVDEFLVRVYLRALEPHDIGLCADVVAELIRSHKFFPKPADIIERLEGAAHSRALAAWPEVERLAGNYRNAKSDDVLTESVVAQMGGWQRFGMAESREWPFLQKEFVDRYETFSTTPGLLEVAERGLIAGPRQAGSIQELLDHE